MRDLIRRQRARRGTFSGKTMTSLAALLLAAPFSLAQTVADYPVTTGGSGPNGIAKIKDPLGTSFSVFFTETNANKIGQAAMDGSIPAEYTVPTAASQPYGIAGGADGNLWFTEYAGNQIGRCTYTGTIVEFPIPTAASHPWGIAAGPDGKLWFTESTGNMIGKVTTAGAVTEFPIPTGGSLPQGIAAGPDGNLWFVEFNGNQIGRITTAGVITEFPIPTVNAGAYEIAAGMDGNLWFTEHGVGKIGRITPAGVITEFPLASAVSGPYGIRAHVDGNMWFVEEAGNQVGRITPAGVITEFAVPTAAGAPRGLVVGDDDGLWFTEFGGNRIGRVETNWFVVPSGSRAVSMTAGPDGNVWTAHATNAGRVTRTTPSGVLTEIQMPTPSSLSGITAGPDGNLWVAERGVSKVGRITPAGTITEFPVPSIPNFIAVGADGNLWFTEDVANKVARITTGGTVTEFSVTTLSSGLSGITAGSDGALWFSENTADRVGRITTAGIITEYPLPGGCNPQDIVAAGDGNLWVQCNTSGATYPVTTAGVIGTSRTIGGPGSHLAVGPDGNLWGANVNFLVSLRVSDFSIRTLPLAGHPLDPPPMTAGRNVNLWLGVRTSGLGVNVVRFALPQTPAALDVDATGNRVFDPGETVTIAPTWRNWGPTTVLTAGLPSFTGPPGATYGIDAGFVTFGTISTSTAGSCATVLQPCYQVTVSNPTTRPLPHWDATLSEEFSAGFSNERKDWTLHIGNSFADVPSSTGTYRFVETLFHKGVTAGCGGGNYCPGSNSTRAQMAVFLLVAANPAGYAPPPCTSPVFGDVPCSSGFAPWVNELFARGVTAGCGGGNYCPTDPVTRAQMAVFLLRTKEGNAYTPPDCVTPTFSDVPCSSGFARWIEELARRGVTAGCGGGNYCPGTPVTRGQMAVFLTTTYGLTLYGP